MDPLPPAVEPPAVEQPAVEQPAVELPAVELPAVELRGAARRYRIGSSTVTALAGVDLTIGVGELVVVLGPSGSGKTTLLNLLGALDRATEGTVRVGGVDLSDADAGELARVRREVVSFVFQSFNLFPTLTALENVQFGAESAGRHGSRAIARSVLASVGLAERERHFPHELSGGEQQRVAIARALARGNPLLLADEPTGELDVETGRQILGLLAQAAGQGRTVVVVTHNREISRSADRVVELSGGRIVSDGPPTGGRVPIAELHW
jgi:putative ABC transport system ATP-binding protein